MSPGGAVEALDDAADGVAGGVLHRNGGAFAILGELKKGHDGVVEASLGLRLNLDSLGGDREDIALVGTVSELGEVADLGRNIHAVFLKHDPLALQLVGKEQNVTVETSLGKIHVGVPCGDFQRRGIHVGNQDFLRLGIFGLSIGIGIGFCYFIGRSRCGIVPLGGRVGLGLDGPVGGFLGYFPARTGYGAQGCGQQNCQQK